MSTWKYSGLLAVLLLLLITKIACANEAGEAYMELKFGLFTHWGINTYSGTTGWDGDPEDYPSSIVSPTDFDAFETAEAAANAGMKYIIFTAKHHYGWCGWDSSYTDYDIATSSTPLLDPLREIADAAAAYDLDLVIYYSVLDRTHFFDEDTERNDSPEYLAFANNQLTELLTQYAPVAGIWFDTAAWTTPSNLTEMRNHVKSISPNTVVIFNVGPVVVDPRSDVITREGIEPEPDNVEPYEMALNLYEGVSVGWWATSDTDGPSSEFTPDGIIELRNLVNDRNANLAVNIPIGPNGRISDAGRAFMADMGTLLQAFDTDGDGVVDSTDNCTLVSNPAQRDTDSDGFGNICDADLNGDLQTNLTDFSLFRAAFGTAYPDADFDGNGSVNLTDFSLFKVMFGSAPGPSGLNP